MERLRRPFLVAALVLALLALALELGSLGLLGGAVGAGSGALDTVALTAPEVRGVLPEGGAGSEFLDRNRPPGLGVPYLALLDALLLLSLGVMGAGLLLPQRVLGRAVGVLTLLVSLLLLVGGILLVLVALFALLLMVSLFLAAPFGTAAYLAIYGFFARGEAAAVLGALLVVKLALGACLLLAHPRFLQNRGLLVLLAGSLLLTLLVGFLHGVVPGFLASIADALGAVIVGIVASLWALVVLVGSVVAIGRTLRLRT